MCVEKTMMKVNVLIITLLVIPFGSQNFLLNTTYNVICDLCKNLHKITQMFINDYSKVEHSVIKMLRVHVLNRRMVTWCMEMVIMKLSN